MKKETLFCVMLFTLLAGCAPRDKAAAFPKGFFFTNGRTIDDMIPTEQDGSFDEESATNIIKASFCPIVVLSELKDPSLPATVSEMPLDSLNVQPKIFQITEASGRQYYALDSDFGITYILQFAEKAKFSYLLEYNLRPKNPQYRLYFNVEPVELMQLQESFQRRGRRCLTLFSSHLYAPELFMIHEINSIEASVSFPVYFKANGGMIRETKSSYGQRLVFRKYQDENRVKRLVTDGTAMMFMEASKDAPVFEGDNIQPHELVFEHNGKKYQCASAYMDHLQAENVTFKYRRTRGPIRVKSTEEIDGALIPVTTEGFLKKR